MWFCITVIVVVVSARKLLLNISIFKCEKSLLFFLKNERLTGGLPHLPGTPTSIYIVRQESIILIAVMYDFFLFLNEF